MLSLIQLLKAETRVNTEGFLSLMQPWGPKLTIPWTSQVDSGSAVVQAKGPPESPCRRAGGGNQQRLTVQVRRLSDVFDVDSLCTACKCWYLSKTWPGFWRQMSVLCSLKPFFNSKPFFFSTSLKFQLFPCPCSHECSLSQTNNVPMFSCPIMCENRAAICNQGWLITNKTLNRMLHNRQPNR